MDTIVSLKIFTNMNLLNYKAVSEVLTGGKESVRLHRVPKRHKAAVSELIEFCENWQKKWGK